MRNQYLVETACPRVPALTHQYLELGLPLNSALRAAEADLWEPENLGLGLAKAAVTRLKAAEEP
jgi:hypothetical protein